MPRFSIRNPYFIIVCCLALLVIGVTSVARMPVDLFPSINLPEVVVATFYSGMPPQDIEIDMTNPLERFFTLASGIDHMESRSMLGVSIIKIYFQPGTNADADVTEISNLALADLKRLPPGTLPPVVLKFDASSLPVCLVTVKGEGLTETQLHDYAQFAIRNQIAVVKGAEIPPPFGGKYRQAMVYVDPYKLLSRQMTPMDVVHAVNQSNLILPAGDVKMGPYDYYVYSNSLVNQVKDLNDIPIKTVGTSWVTVGDVGKAEDANQIQYNEVRVDGQKSCYIPIMKQGGDTNTIEVVNGIRDMIGHLFDIPKQMTATLVFDQSVFVKEAIKTLLHEGLIGLVLTSIMILLFLGSLRATSAVFLSIPLSALATFVVLYLMGSTVNTMILGGLALAFSRVIDNSVISLENIYRHLEMGSLPEAAAEAGGNEVSLAVLAATLTTVVVFFPVTFLYGVSKFLFTALALAVVISLFASYFVAMTVIPLFCSRFLKQAPHAEGHRQEAGGGTGGGTGVPPVTGTAVPAVAHDKTRSFWAEVQRRVQPDVWQVARLLRVLGAAGVGRPGRTVVALAGLFLASLAIYPFIGLAFFPRTDAGQFTINLKVPTGTRIEVTNEYVAKVENLIRKIVDPRDFKLVVSNIGVVPDFSSLYTTNAGPYTATVQVQLQDEHRHSSFDYMEQVQEGISKQYPEVRTFFSSGSMVDAILNMGMPAPIDVQVSSSDLDQSYKIAQDLARQIRGLGGVGAVYIPQDKISFINAVAEVCEVAGADVTQLAEAIGHDDRIGHKFLRAGLGFGGGCLPKDIRAFMARAGELGVDQAVSFLKNIDEINLRCRARTVELAREMCEGSLTGRRVGVLGAAFKPDSDDIRDSPALHVAYAIQRAGAAVRVYDPEAMHNAKDAFPTLAYVPSALEACQAADVVLHMTEWEEFRALRPADLAPIVRERNMLDGRNVLDPDRWRAAGWQFRALGRS